MPQILCYELLDGVHEVADGGALAGGLDELRLAVAGVHDVHQVFQRLVRPHSQLLLAQRHTREQLHEATKMKISKAIMNVSGITLLNNIINSIQQTYQDDKQRLPTLPLKSCGSSLSLTTDMASEGVPGDRVALDCVKTQIKTDR